MHLNLITIVILPYILKITTTISNILQLLFQTARVHSQHIEKSQK